MSEGIRHRGKKRGPKRQHATLCGHCGQLTEVREFLYYSIYNTTRVVESYEIRCLNDKCPTRVGG